MLGYLQGTHCEYHKALDGHNNDSYAYKAVDGPRRFMAGTARNLVHYKKVGPLGFRHDAELAAQI